VALLLGAYALRLFAGWQAHETAQRLLRAGNPTDALLEQQRARRLDPRNPLMAVRMAAIENAAGDADAAEAQWREATRLEPRSPFLHAALGDLLLTRGKEAEAIRSFETAEELQPQWPLRYQRLSRVQLDIGAREFQAGRTAAAKPHLDAVLEQQRLLRQRLREQPDWIRTRRARRGGDTDPIVDFDAGRAKLLLGQPAAAMHDLESALRAPATQPDVWAWLAVAYARSGDPERAADAHRRAVAAKPELEPMIRAIDLFAGRAGSSTPVQR
jgi:Tfp pilus assembly protein PilF